jgi:hypothetical protein
MSDPNNIQAPDSQEPVIPAPPTKQTFTTQHGNPQQQGYPAGYPQQASQMSQPIHFPQAQPYGMHYPQQQPGMYPQQMMYPPQGTPGQPPGYPQQQQPMYQGMPGQPIAYPPQQQMYGQPQPPAYVQQQQPMAYHPGATTGMILAPPHSLTPTYPQQQPAYPAQSYPHSSQPILEEEHQDNIDQLLGIPEHEEGEMYRPPVLTEIEHVKPPHPFIVWWKKFGGESFLLSVAVHVGLFFLVGSIVWAVASAPQPADFLPGGGSRAGAAASSSLSNTVKQKKQSKLTKTNTSKRLVSTNINASVSLPDAPMEALDVPDISSSMGGGKMGSGGFGGGGSGGGFGKGKGAGSLSGTTFKPIMMFGKELKGAKRIAVLMDVSLSMTKYLPTVVSELDKVAKGSILMMYIGCGISPIPDNQVDKLSKFYNVFPAKADNEKFNKFWQWFYGEENQKEEDRRTGVECRKGWMDNPASVTFNKSKGFGFTDIYGVVTKRAGSMMYDHVGPSYAHKALTDDQMKEVDTIYWFADFADKADPDEMKKVLDILLERKQKLYIHASIKGRFFEDVVNGLVTPSGGEVISSEVKS